jgi:ABC-type polysaccharide transport system permease subunit
LTVFIGILYIAQQLHKGGFNIMSKSLVAAKPSRGFTKKKKTLILLSMVAPGTIWLILLRYLPMLGIVIAFQDFKIYSKAPRSGIILYIANG